MLNYKPDEVIIMAKPKAKVTTRQQKNWTEAEILKILDDTINLLLTDDTFFYTSYYIASQRLPRATLSDWCGRSQAVQSTHNEMRELSEGKIANELLKARGGSVSTIGGLFVLKAKYQWVEEQHRKVDPTTVTTDVIEVGFSDEDND